MGDYEGPDPGIDERGERPEDPAPAPAADEPSEDRRRFLERVSVALGASAAVLVLTPVTGFLVSPLLRRVPEAWRTIGPVEGFRPGATVKVTYLDAEVLPWAGFAARSAAWLRRDGENEFVAFSIYCTHTACPVRWLEDTRMFLCPCHGGAFYRDGSVAAGPPPRPLDRLPVRVRDGQVEILAAGVPTPGGALER